MKYIMTNWALPFYNFALEAYLLQEAPEDDYMFFYVHKPSVIVGKHQNALEEVNQKYIEDHDITVARRLSGGGAVYHDAGNLNFSFVQKASIEDMHDFEKFTSPVVNVLKSLGLDASLSGRNDILLKDMKISGNAQYFKNNRILSHGTLLYDADMSKLQNALNVDPLKIQSKGVKSVRSRVTNIRDHLKEDMTIGDFQDYLKSGLIKDLGAEPYELNEEALDWIYKKVEEQFSQWTWNWGESPECNVIRKAKFDCGIIDARIDVEEGILKRIKFYGDFFVKEDIENLENHLSGMPFYKDALIEALTQEMVNTYFKDLELEIFVEFLVYG